LKILLCSHVFAPDIGGIETVSALLAAQFSSLGSAVTVVTHTPGGPVSSAYEVVRRPSLRKLRALTRQADIVFQSNISLRTLLPLLLCGKPIVVTHHTYLTRVDGRLGWRDHIKRALLSRCHNISVSKAIADELPVKSTVIGNPFDSQEFAAWGANDRDTQREKDIVFLGRLVSDKGCDLALHALAQLKAEGICPSFTVIGDGPQRAALERLAVELHIAAQVDFRGVVRESRGRELARHTVMVIPSIWAEPFGLVALEGLAAGCVVAASSAGGLPEAVGPCGLLFPNGDVKTMAAILKSLIVDAGLREQLLVERDRHLQRFQPGNVAREYLAIFESALSK